MRGCATSSATSPGTSVQNETLNFPAECCAHNSLVERTSPAGLTNVCWCFWLGIILKELQLRNNNHHGASPCVPSSCWSHFSPPSLAPLAPRTTLPPRTASSAPS